LLHYYGNIVSSDDSHVNAGIFVQFFKNKLVKNKLVNILVALLSSKPLSSAIKSALAHDNIGRARITLLTPVSISDVYKSI